MTTTTTTTMKQETNTNKVLYLLPSDVAWNRSGKNVYKDINFFTNIPKLKIDMDPETFTNHEMNVGASNNFYGKVWVVIDKKDYNIYNYKEHQLGKCVMNLLNHGNTVVITYGPVVQDKFSDQMVMLPKYRKNLRLPEVQQEHVLRKRYQQIHYITKVKHYNRIADPMLAHVAKELADSGCPVALQSPQDYEPINALRDLLFELKGESLEWVKKFQAEKKVQQAYTLDEQIQIWSNIMLCPIDMTLPEVAPKMDITTELTQKIDWHMQASYESVSHCQQLEKKKGKCLSVFPTTVPNAPEQHRYETLEGDELFARKVAQFYIQAGIDKPEPDREQEEKELEELMAWFEDLKTRAKDRGQEEATLEEIRNNITEYAAKFDRILELEFKLGIQLTSFDWVLDQDKKDYTDRLDQCISARR